MSDVLFVEFQTLKVSILMKTLKGLADRLLSILDLSSAGHQPIGSLCVRFTLEFNDDICNHLDLRQVLEKKRGAFNLQRQSNT